MKTSYLRIALALAGFAAFAISAKAQTVDQPVVNIPFQFVVAGTTLPAGEYRVTRLYDYNPRVLIFSSYENRASVIVIPTEIEDSLHGKTHFTFEAAGGQHVLSSIQTLDHVYNFDVPSADALQAATPHQSGGSGSPSSGTK